MIIMMIVITSMLMLMIRIITIMIMIVRVVIMIKGQQKVGDPQYPVRCTTAIPELSPGRRWTGVIIIIIGVIIMIMGLIIMIIGVVIVIMGVIIVIMIKSFYHGIGDHLEIKSINDYSFYKCDNY